jgi:hypothetical protein
MSTPTEKAATMAAAPAPLYDTNVTFPLSKIPPNPLGEGKYIKTAAALIIGLVLQLNAQEFLLTVHGRVTYITALATRF